MSARVENSAEPWLPSQIEAPTDRVVVAPVRQHVSQVPHPADAWVVLQPDVALSFDLLPASESITTIRVPVGATRQPRTSPGLHRPEIEDVDRMLAWQSAVTGLAVIPMRGRSTTERPDPITHDEQLLALLRNEVTTATCREGRGRTTTVMPKEFAEWLAEMPVDCRAVTPRSTCRRGTTSTDDPAHGLREDRVSWVAQNSPGRRSMAPTSGRSQTASASGDDSAPWTESETWRFPRRTPIVRRPTLALGGGDDPVLLGVVVASTVRPATTRLLRKAVPIETPPAAIADLESWRSSLASPTVRTQVVLPTLRRPNHDEPALRVEVVFVPLTIDSVRGLVVPPRVGALTVADFLPGFSADDEIIAEAGRAVWLVAGSRHRFPLPRGSAWPATPAPEQSITGGLSHLIPDAVAVRGRVVRFAGGVCLLVLDESQAGGLPMLPDAVTTVAGLAWRRASVAKQREPNWHAAGVVVIPAPYGSFVAGGVYSAGVVAGQVVVA